MQRAATEFIDAVDSGKPATESDHVADHGSESGIGGPEIIDFGFDTIEPSTAKIGSDSPGDSGSGPRTNRHGRVDGRTRAARAARGEAPKGASAVEAKISLHKLVSSAHNIAATLLDIQELSLDDSESKDLADSIQNVAKFYVTTFDPKKVAIAELLLVAGGLYTTRYMAYRMRKEMEGPKKNVVPISHTPAQTATSQSLPKSKVNGAAPKPPNEMTPSDIWNEPAGFADFIG